MDPEQGIITKYVIKFKIKINIFILMITWGKRYILSKLKIERLYEEIEDLPI